MTRNIIFTVFFNLFFGNTYSQNGFKISYPETQTPSSMFFIELDYLNYSWPLNNTDLLKSKKMIIKSVDFDFSEEADIRRTVYYNQYGKIEKEITPNPYDVSSNDTSYYYYDDLKRINSISTIGKLYSRQVDYKYSRHKIICSESSYSNSDTLLTITNYNYDKKKWLVSTETSTSGNCLLSLINYSENSIREQRFLNCEKSGPFSYTVYTMLSAEKGLYVYFFPNGAPIVTSVEYDNLGKIDTIYYINNDGSTKLYKFQYQDNALLRKISIYKTEYMNLDSRNSNVELEKEIYFEYLNN